MSDEMSRIILVGAGIFVGFIMGFWFGNDRAALEPKRPDQSARDKSGSRRSTANLVNNGEVFLNTNAMFNGGSTLASKYMQEAQDSDSLDQLRSMIQQRAIRGIDSIRAELAEAEKKIPAKPVEVARLRYKLGTLLVYEGKFSEAVAEIEASLKIGEQVGSSAADMADIMAVLGLIALRRGEVDNCVGCVGPSSCILPLSPEAKHTRPAGSREAIQRFTEYLAIAPGDLRARWVLNLAYMTLNEYPDQVPREFLIPVDTFDSKVDIGRFDNVAPDVGLISRGPNQAGGSVFDDFTGDGLPDLFVTSLDVDRGAAFFVNLGNGQFEDRSQKAGLDDQVYALNLMRADYDNDGNPDVILLRGGWEKPMRMTLLRNLGDSRFEDVTISSGLEEPIASETAAWGDYDNDGLLDLFVGGEYIPASPPGSDYHPDPRNRNRLYHNEGGGKFVNVAAQLGVADEQCTKGSAWGDYDADGRLDLFVSNMNGVCRLYHQEADGRFRDVAREAGVNGPPRPFACWFWDYDNDGLLDLYVNDYSGSLAEFVATQTRMALKRHSRPRLYRNVGSGHFQDVTIDVGLDRSIMPMGCNFADIDNDGFLDLYFGTGSMSLEILVPNLMFKNDSGKTFLDITTTSGTGHLQKGHGTSFADWDCDGNLDLYVVAGGAVPGDRSYNLLFQNPDHGRHWLKVKLIGTKTNRSAMGAQIKATIKASDGTLRSIYRTIGNNSSFGGNSLVESIGLLDATSVSELQISWPGSKTIQSFRDISGDQMIEITEEVDSIKSIPLERISVPRHQ
jgi:hypothetical protein